MTKPIIAGTRPKLVKFEKKGDTVLWCACGRSKNQPFCDGSHRGSGIVPARLIANCDGEEALLCLCKQTKSPPYCDGSHNALADRYAVGTAEEVHGGEIRWADASLVPRSHGDKGRASLDGGCYVLTIDTSAMCERQSEIIGGLRMTSTIGPGDGADNLSQWLVEPTSDQSEAITFGASECVLFVAAGDVELFVAGKRIGAPAHSAVSVRPGESVSVIGGAGAVIVATVCPPCPPRVGNGDAPFDSRFPRRIGMADPEARKEMGDRYFQVLTSHERGAETITQFIGVIPKSRAAAHRHLYEETLYVLSGEGFMWTETRRAPVKRGDIIYLPRKQLHSLECVSPDGMQLAGSFFPAGSPAINY